MLVNLEFNLFKEIMKEKIKSQFSSTISNLGFSEENFNARVTLFIDSKEITFDDEFLSLNDFLMFCETLGIEPAALCDNYYSFILSDYGNKIYTCRTASGLNQKQFAKLTKISPVDIYKFESKIKYPNRNQYEKLKELLL